MATVEAPTLITTEQLLAMPDDGVERWLIHGQLREKTRTYRNRGHSRAAARVCRFLDEWLDTQPEPRGSVLVGDAGVRLTHDPDTTVGIDVVFISANVAANNPDGTKLIDGVPVVAVEVLSPNNTVDEIEETIDQYLKAGVPLVWIVNPFRRTVTIHRPDKESVLLNASQDLTGEPHLPGFRVRVADLFA